MSVLFIAGSFIFLGYERMIQIKNLNNSEQARTTGKNLFLMLVLNMGKFVAKIVESSYISAILYCDNYISIDGVKKGTSMEERTRSVLHFQQSKTNSYGKRYLN